MDRDWAEQERGSGRVPAYPSTMWTEVERAGNADDPVALEALDSLLSKYYRPLQRHLISKFHATEDQAADWLQSFVWKKVLLDKLIARADRDRGKFRTFLLNALDNFVVSELRKVHADIRQPTGGIVSLEEVPGQQVNELADKTDPDFDFDWAGEVLDETLRLMKAGCAEWPGRWEVFKLRLLDPILDQRDTPRYEELVRQFGFESPSAASNVLITARKMFQRCLRKVVAEYVGDGPEKDIEIDVLLAALRKKS